MKREIYNENDSYVDFIEEVLLPEYSVIDWNSYFNMLIESEEAYQEWEEYMSSEEDYWLTQYEDLIWFNQNC